jgi:CHASE domain
MMIEPNSHDGRRPPSKASVKNQQQQQQQQQQQKLGDTAVEVSEDAAGQPENEDDKDGECIRINSNSNSNSNCHPKTKAKKTTTKSTALSSVVPPAASSTTTTITAEMKMKQRALRTSLIVFITSLAGAVAFTTLGILQANAAASTAFFTRATELGALMQATWKEYEHAALTLHNICRRHRNTTRREFRDFYEYLIADGSGSSSTGTSHGGLEFESAQCSPNVTHAERSRYEDEARAFYATHYPTINYTGIVGFVQDNVTGELSVVPVSPVRPFYFPVHYLEPVLPNAPAIELDMYSFPSQKLEIDLAVSTRQPVLSKRLHVVQEWQEFAYSVIIYHPGIPLKSDNTYESSSTNATTNVTRVSENKDDDDDVEDPVQDLSLILVRIPSLLHRVALVQKESLALYLYDTTILNTNGGVPEFLGAGAFTVTKNETTGGAVSQRLSTIPEMDYNTFVAKYNANADGRKSNHYYYENTVPITPSGATWIIAVVPVDDDTYTYAPNLLYVWFGGVMILGAGVVVATWIYMNAKRDAALNELRITAASERAALIVKNAEEAAQTERELYVVLLRRRVVCVLSTIILSFFLSRFFLCVCVLVFFFLPLRPQRRK